MMVLSQPWKEQALKEVRPTVRISSWQWYAGPDWVQYSEQLCWKLECTFEAFKSGVGDGRKDVDVGGGRHVDVSTHTQLVTDNHSRRRPVRRINIRTQEELSTQRSARLLFAQGQHPRRELATPKYQPLSTNGKFATGVGAY